VDVPGQATSAPAKPRVDWVNALFLAAVHVLGAGGLAWLVLVRCSPATIALAVGWNVACSLSITGGYHRLFAHRSYDCIGALKVFYLLFGAASVQNSALSWSSKHRFHHSDTDGERDPYSAARGFWWSHVGWVLFRSRDDFSNVKDLAADPLVRLQHRHYLLLAALFGFAIPITLGWSWGDAVGALLVACCLRLVVPYHSTFAINSFAPWLGARPWSKANSARDSWVTALVTLGEGYHNFHHRFPADYRNGVRRRDFDPTKWWLWLLSRVGVTRNLKRMAPERMREARMQAGSRARALTPRGSS